MSNGWINEIARQVSSNASLFRARARGRALRKKRRVIRRYTTYVQEQDFSPEIMNMSENVGKQVYLGASDIRDYKISNWFEHFTGDDLITRTLNLHCSKAEWQDYIETFRDIHQIPAYIYEFDSNYGTIFNPSGYVDYHLHTKSIEVKVFGTIAFTKAIIADLKQRFEEVSSYIEWMYASDGSSVRVPMDIGKLPIDKMYPFLGDKSLTEYYDDYLKSTANTLILIGPPGTGKTSFIRGLLAHAQQSASVTYDANILEKDYIFAQFIEGDCGIMVMEDCDKFLGSRADGNTMMHKFLNVGDGLVTTKGKKLIFSTNLPSIRDIDPALIRPGRCFDVVTFEELTKSQAKELAEVLGIELTQDKSSYTIAEIFHEQTHKPKIRKVGFV